MTASLQTKKERPNYFIVLAYKDISTGKNKTKWISTDIPIKGNNKRIANERMKEVLAENKNLHVDLSKDVLFTVFIKEWLENTKTSISTVTYDTYRLIIHNQVVPFYETKKLKLRDITPLHIQQYMNYKLKTVSPNTVKKHLWTISKCFNSAERQNLIAFNPVKRIDMPQTKKYIGAQHYNENQIEKLLGVIKGDVIEKVILLTLFYGLRRSEVLGLKWDAINFENNTIIIQHTNVQMGTKMHKNDSTKNSSSYRTLPMVSITRELLLDLKEYNTRLKLLLPNDYNDEGYIFMRQDGKIITPNYVTKHFKLILQKSDLPTIRFHDIRHSTASYLLYLGFSMKEIQVWLGHGDIGTTMNIYAHLDISSKQNMAKVLNEKFCQLNV